MLWFKLLPPCLPTLDSELTSSVKPSRICPFRLSCSFCKSMVLITGTALSRLCLVVSYLHSFPQGSVHTGECHRLWNGTIWVQNMICPCASSVTLDKLLNLFVSYFSPQQYEDNNRTYCIGLLRAFNLLDKAHRTASACYDFYFVCYCYLLSLLDYKLLEVNKLTEFIFVVPQRDSASPHDLSYFLPEESTKASS